MKYEIKFFYKYFLDVYKKDFWSVPASRANHHAWVGGLYDHCSEMIATFNNMIKTSQFENKKLDYDIIELAIWLHDAHKIFDYEMGEVRRGKREIISTKQNYVTRLGTVKTLLMIAEYNANALLGECIPISDKLGNCIAMAEGGYSHFASGRGLGHMEMTHEAAIVHACDITSSHIIGSSKEV